MTKFQKLSIIISLLAIFFSTCGIMSSCEIKKKEKVENGQWQPETEANKDEVRVNKIETEHFYQYSFTSIRDITWLDTYLTNELNISPDRIISIYMVYNKEKGWNSYRVVVRK